ncbi:hypothetical protein FHG66_20285 [Rubellimicrobium rubrum]|uniref:CR-type domain-containing protein n=1 Tax=Rubellimicrobium rubrum TaxID=2585369 RepID=A0A5C4MIT7_9RHOB|nr:hypothetical protein [Rubellimicrobium rubrum]TNC45134.1 hypothetical protein FHG66_20285 [Rubellimicrobium rubrum]
MNSQVSIDELSIPKEVREEADFYGLGPQQIAEMFRAEEHRVFYRVRFYGDVTTMNDIFVPGYEGPANETKQVIDAGSGEAWQEKRHARLHEDEYLETIADDLRAIAKLPYKIWTTEARWSETCERCHGQCMDVCTTCRRAGRVTCTGCGGHGNGTCWSCSGRGAGCSTCYGRGNHVCSGCNGIGTRQCSSCSGKGVRACRTCQGSGREAKKSRKATHISWHSSIDEISTPVNPAEIEEFLNVSPFGLASEPSARFEKKKSFVRGSQLAGDWTVEGPVRIIRHADGRVVSISGASSPAVLPAGAHAVFRERFLDLLEKGQWAEASQSRLGQLVIEHALGAWKPTNYRNKEEVVANYLGKEFVKATRARAAKDLWPRIRRGLWPLMAMILFACFLLGTQAGDSLSRGPSPEGLTGLGFLLVPAILSRPLSWFWYRWEILRVRWMGFHPSIYGRMIPDPKTWRLVLMAYAAVAAGVAFDPLRAMVLEVLH